MPCAFAETWFSVLLSFWYNAFFGHHVKAHLLDLLYGYYIKRLRVRVALDPTLGPSGNTVRGVIRNRVTCNGLCIPETVY